jgi:lipopolysaccharide biosynthesis glycosyltransferase
MNSEINIALGFDGSYAPHTAAVMASIVRHASSGRICFIMLCTDVNSILRSQMEMIAPKARFIWIEVQERDLPRFAARGHFNRTTLFRLGLESLAPADCRRVLYLDSDLIVLADICKLWATDLGCNSIAAVQDAYVDPIAFANRWQLSPPSKYFNAGVLLIDLEKVRAGRMFSAAIEFLVRNERDLRFNDQDALNWAFWNQWCFLDIMWNVQRFMTSVEMRSQGIGLRQSDSKGPQLVHFIGMEKPWMPGVWHPWAWLYWENLVRTPFAEDVARQFGMNFYQLMRLRLRWWIKRPYIRPRWLGV